MNKKKFTYKKSGVNIIAADNFVNFISTVSSKEKGKKKFSNIGGFGSISNIPNNIKKLKAINTTGLFPANSKKDSFDMWGS